MASNFFSPNGHLLLVDYADESVRKSPTIVGLCTRDCVILAAEKVADVLKVERREERIKIIDENIAMAFTGLSMDTRAVYRRVQLEAQSYRLHFNDAAEVDYMSRFLADAMHSYTRGSTVRPFGVTCLIGGFENNGKPQLFRIDPSGVFTEWLINTAGRMDQTINEYLETNLKAISTCSNQISAMKYVVRALHIASSSDANSFEMAVLKYNQPIEFVSKDMKKYLTELIKRETMGYTTRRHFGFN